MRDVKQLLMGIIIVTIEPSHLLNVFSHYSVQAVNDLLDFVNRIVISIQATVVRCIVYITFSP